MFCFTATLFLLSIIYRTAASITTDTSAFCDPTTKLCFQQFQTDDDDLSISIAFPPLGEPFENEFLVQVSVSTEYGWAGFSFTDDIETALVLWGRRNQRSEPITPDSAIITSPTVRISSAQDELLPIFNSGTPQMTLIESESSVTADRLTATFSCTNCLPDTNAKTGESSFDVNAATVPLFAILSHIVPNVNSALPIKFEPGDIIPFTLNLRDAHTNTFPQET